MPSRNAATPLALAAALAWALGPGAAPALAQASLPDTVRISTAPGDTIRLEERRSGDGEEAGPPRRVRSEEPLRWGTPFAVETSGRVEPRPERAEVVWMAPGAARVAARPDTAARPPARDTAAARPAAPPRPAPAPPARPAGRRETRARTHTVAAGETFYGIARRYGVTSAALRAANPDARWQNLRTGEVLRIPSGGSASASSGSSAPSGGSRASTARRTHTVVRGETLYGIARRYGLSMERIREANRLERDQVNVGQVLVIPSGD